MNIKFYCAGLLLAIAAAWDQPAQAMYYPSQPQSYCKDDLDSWEANLQQREQLFNQQTLRSQQQIQWKLRQLKIQEVLYKSQTMNFYVDETLFDKFIPTFAIHNDTIQVQYPFTPQFQIDPFFNNWDPNVNTCPYRFKDVGIKGYRDIDVLKNMDPKQVQTCPLAPTPNRIFHTILNHCQWNKLRGQCTEWADGRYYQLTGIHVPFIDHAGNWSKYAPYEGWIVSKTPIVPSILVLTPPPEDHSSPGHVAVVENVYSNGYICTSHWNSPRPKLLAVRQEPINPEYNFVYHPDGVAKYYASFTQQNNRYNSY
ncbi:hypothetical protein DSO57_1018382 [Entomophthora muscae]|uniref:Uncharacterized protein n=1 Tax=Entomophthora muscae TaxID=34485 RepID=A0ACC2T4Q4_9FUNG|nr:hypothetical protein DSO57_1018382 [Entomophthora muscae]